MKHPLTLSDAIDMVAHFHEDFGVPVRYNEIYKPLPAKERILRIQLLLEEVKELATSFGIDVQYHVPPQLSTPEVAPAKMLDHVVDIGYVLFGAVCTLGLQRYYAAAFEEVHRSNMSKRNPDGSVTKNDHGKIVKPPTYSHPDLERIIREVKRRNEDSI